MTIQKSRTDIPGAISDGALSGNKLASDAAQKARSVRY